MLCLVPLLLCLPEQDIPDLHLQMYRTVTDASVWICRESKFCTCRLWVRVLGYNFREDGLGGQNATLHGRVGPFDLWHVHETGAAADQQAPGESQLWDGLKQTNSWRVLFWGTHQHYGKKTKQNDDLSPVSYEWYEGKFNVWTISSYKMNLDA